MRRLPCWIALGIAALAPLNSLRAADPPPFEWKDGDRVVLIGDTLIERNQKYGYLETRITAGNPGKSITFRNLGWSGDTVFGHARARFGKPADGFQHLQEHVVALKPTVLVVGYGMVESFDGEAGLPAFVAGLNTLLDAVTASKPRLILLSPIAHEDLGRPLPDPTRHNADLARYRDAIKKVADARSAWFVDLYEPTVSAHVYGIDPLTDNGIHPNAYGHWYLDMVIDTELRRIKKDPAWALLAKRLGSLRANYSKVSDFQKTLSGLRFDLISATLPDPPLPPGAPADAVSLVSWRNYKLEDLARGPYTLTIDQKALTTADATEWAKGVRLNKGPDFAQVEVLRQAINAKNELYFYRWRPQNETYLFGFRKHEQGNNASEIPLFDPLVEEKEQEIARLRQPVKHVYELTREGELVR